MKKVMHGLVLLFLCAASCFAQGNYNFFMDNGPRKKIDRPPFIKHQVPAASTSVALTLDYSAVAGRVSKYLYGTNSNTYMGKIVDQPVLMNHITKLAPNIIRFPGGNLSNLYFWNASKDNRPTDVPKVILYGDQRPLKNEQLWYGIDPNPSTLSLENYYQLLKKTASTGMICVNYSYARYGTGNDPVKNAAHLAADWVRHDKGRTKFWEIGNENYGTWQAGYKIDTTLNKDHQPAIISGKLYGEHLKVFVDSMKSAAKEIASEIFIGAVMIETAKDKSWEGEINKNWNAELLQVASSSIDYYVVHNYYTPYDQNSTPEVILNSATNATAEMSAYMKELSKVYQLPEKPLALTEWNIFAVGAKQSCSFINGMHAAIVLGELATHQFGMASRWNLANGYANGDDHGMFNKGDEFGVPLWNPRPAYYYMYYFQRFFGDDLLRAPKSPNPNLLVYASRFQAGAVGAVVVNKGQTSEITELSIENFKTAKTYYLYSLTGGTDNGGFSQKVLVNGKTSKFLAGGPADPEKIKAFSASTDSKIKFESAPLSVQFLLVE